MAGKTKERWIDCSGAPPMLISQKLSSVWRGTTDPRTGKYRQLDLDKPITCYDHVCAATSAGNGILEFMGSSVLAFYTEDDLHSWDSRRQLVAGGGWMPSDRELRKVEWINPMEWIVRDEKFLLINSAVDVSRGIDEGDLLEVHLEQGHYRVETCRINNHAHSDSCFHHLSLLRPSRNS